MQITIKVLLKTYILLSLLILLTGCKDNTDRPINLRDMAIQKAKVWEKKRYEDILTQKEIPI